MMKLIYYSSLLLITTLYSCSKEDTVEETTNTTPSISISKPYENFTTKLGGWLPLEGIAIDIEGVKSVHYEITSPDASYNYTSANSMNVSGTYADFNNGITLHEGACVGEAILKVYTKDTENNRSPTISRNFIINDEIPYIITILKDTTGASDIMEVQAFKNTNNVVDSLVVLNQTRSETLAIITDKGGFKSFNFENNQRDLINNFQNSYTHQFNIQSSGFPTLSFYEYDGSYEAINFFLY